MLMVCAKCCNIFMDYRLQHCSFNKMSVHLRWMMWSQNLNMAHKLFVASIIQEALTVQVLTRLQLGHISSISKTTGQGQRTWFSPGLHTKWVATDKQISAMKYLHSIVKWFGVQFKQPVFQFSIHNVEVFHGIVTHPFNPMEHSPYWIIRTIGCKKYCVICWRVCTWILVLIRDINTSVVMDSEADIESAVFPRVCRHQNLGFFAAVSD